MFHESFIEEEISRMFQGCFMIKGVSRVFQGSFKKTFKVFQESFLCMALIAASRAEGGLVIFKQDEGRKWFGKDFGSKKNVGPKNFGLKNYWV